MKAFLAVLILLLSVYTGVQFIDNFDSESIKGKNVVITGASAGIGEQLAYHYARLGANIVITARRENRLKEVIKKSKEAGRKDANFEYIALDMAENDATEKLISFAEKRLGGIDILVLNHVWYHYGKWHGSSENITQFQQSMNVNFFAYVSAASHAIPALTKSKGSIVVVSSVGGKVPNPNLSTYISAKHALEGFFGSIRDEFIMSGTDISITVCSIGFTETANVLDMMKDLGADKVIESQSGNSASESALAILKGSAQRMQRLHHPMLSSRLAILSYTLFPETLSSLIRDAYVPAE